MTTYEIAKLTVGTRVAFARWHHWGGRPLSYGFGTVSKINGHGHITVVDKSGKLLKPKVFDKYGQERHSSWGHMLVSAESLQANLDSNDRQQSINAKVKAMVEKLEGKKNSHGDIHPDQEVADVLKDLAWRIETNTWA